MQVRETGICEISELQPGEILEVQGGESRNSLCWRPLLISREGVIDSAVDAAAALRSVTRACVHAWASCYTGIIHRLSGGLDSSIVLSCLADTPTKPAITCLNYFSKGPEEDERFYAHLAARRADTELVEEEREPAAVALADILSVRRSAKPAFYLYWIQHGRFEARLASQRRAQALFSGAGGDALFYQAQAVLAAADYTHRHGIGPGLAGVALDAARVANVSVWRVLRSVMRERLRHSNWSPLAEIGAFRSVVNPEVINAVKRDERFIHPWLVDADGAEPGKLWHVLSMGVTPSFYNPFGRASDPEPVFPLMSQPLIELCLRLPTYVLISGGWDRAVARRAFAKDVPPQIINRRTKGGATDNVKRIFDRNTAFIREQMLDGLLVKERILDRRKLEEALSGKPSLAGFAFTEILSEHLCTEVWAKRWSECRQRAAA